MTQQAEALFRFIEQTTETELAGELAFLANYDTTKQALQEVVDMPDVHGAAVANLPVLRPRPE